MVLFDEGGLRHRVDIQKPSYTQDVTTGERKRSWRNWKTGVAAKIVPSSAREFVASQSVQSKIVGRIEMRYLEGITADMRIVHRKTIYNIEGILADPDSGLEYMNIPVSSGVNDG